MALMAVLVAVGLAGVALGIVAYLRLQRATREVAAQATGLQSILGAVLQRLTASAPTQFMVIQDGRAPRGPIDLTTIRAMRLDGRLQDDALVAVAGTDNWHRLGDWLDDDVPT